MKPFNNFIFKMFELRAYRIEENNQYYKTEKGSLSYKISDCEIVLNCLQLVCVINLKKNVTFMYIH